MGLIAFDLEKIIPALFHGGPAILALAVQRISGDDFPIQWGKVFQQLGGSAQFAALGAFLLVVNGHGLRGSILVLGQREQANMIPNHFAIQSQGLRQSACPLGQPGAQERGEGLRVHAGSRPHRSRICEPWRCKSSLAHHFCGAEATADRHPTFNRVW